MSARHTHKRTEYKPGQTLKDELTPLEYERAGLLVIGLDYRSIAMITGRTVYTIRDSFRKMFEKTDTADSLELAVRYAHELMAGQRVNGPTNARQ
jgi:DNA-binding NarL/FixJ family response regulator